MELGGAIQNVFGFIARRLGLADTNTNTTLHSSSSSSSSSTPDPAAAALPSPHTSPTHHHSRDPPSAIADDHVVVARSRPLAASAREAPASGSASASGGSVSTSTDGSASGGSTSTSTAGSRVRGVGVRHGGRAVSVQVDVAAQSREEAAAESVEHFRESMARAEAGTVPLCALLDEMYELKGHPPYNTTRRLATYFADKKVMREMLTILVDETRLVRVPDADDARRRFKYQYVIANTVANGPVTDLRLSLVDDDEMVDILFGYFLPADGIREVQVASEVARVLVVLMDEMPEVMIAHFLRRSRDIIPALVNNIAAPHVAESLIRLVGENDNSDLGNNPIFDIVFIDALRVLATARIFDALATAFAAAANHHQPDERETQQMENTTIVTFGLIMRIAKAIPYGRRNKALIYLNIFENVAAVRTMLNAAIAAYERLPSHPGLVMVINMLVEMLATLYFERQNLVNANNGIDSANLESELVRIFPKLIAILDQEHDNDASPSDKLFGRTRLKIVELSVAAFKSCSEETLMSLFRQGLHDSLWSVLARYPNCSVAHNLVSLSLDICLMHRSVGCQMPWLSELCLPTSLIDIWHDLPEREATTAYSSAILTFISTIWKMSQMHEMDENLGTLKAMMGSDEYDKFVVFYNQEIVALVGSNDQTLGGSKPVANVGGIRPSGVISPDNLQTDLNSESEIRGVVPLIGAGESFLAGGLTGDLQVSPVKGPESRNEQRERRKGSLDSSFFEEPQ